MGVSNLQAVSLDGSAEGFPSFSFRCFNLVEMSSFGFEGEFGRRFDVEALRKGDKGGGEKCDLQFHAINVGCFRMMARLSWCGEG